jgi:non-specific serine/threonine protein kinase
MLKVGEQLSHYKILSAIGAGGMGEVFLAEDPRLHRRVAIKILPEDFAQDAMRMRRFVQEAKATSVLNHPNIITIHEIGETDNKHFIVTEYIEGETLREHINQSPFVLDEALNVAIQIASALQTAHSAQIVHRDIKPENIMIRPDGLIKILDFGIAKLIEKKVEPIDEEAATLATKSQTLAGMIIGTAAYMSPEQAQGKEIDSRSDIFSFGVVLYEMLTGKQPFAGETAMDVIARVLHKEPIPLNQLLPEIPSELNRIINKTLDKDRSERYQTARDLLIDLKNIKEELQFQSKLELSLPPNRQAEDNTQIFTAKVTEESSFALALNNLTENPSPIVGREKEIAEVKTLLLQNNLRLVTMTGIGGTGKTTLAKAVARELLTEFSDGVFFAELAAVTDAESVVSTIAQPLGVKETGGKPILEALKDYLRGREILIVVDNFEQVTDAATQISELLSAASRLKILITSRALLHLSIEHEFIVPPLAVPSKIESISLAELSEYEAIKLFVERAQNAKANFTLTEENAKSVAEICARLDGLPLAIELAAARTKILSPQAILSKLENRLKLLTGGAKDLPARQQTMRGAVGWSYDLLSADEKGLFRRLAVFSGGFTFEAAEAVCASHDSDEEYLEVLDLISSLVDKSLLVAKEQSSGDLRFRMLEVVREYALESLEAGDEAEAIRRRHAAYFLAVGEEAEPHLQASQSAEWLDRLEEEHDNLREALGWSLENDPATAARLTAAIRGFWTYHSHLTEGRRWLEAVLVERGSLDAPAAVRFKLLNSLAVNARLQGDYKTARGAYEKGLAAGNEANDSRQIALSSRGLGAVFYQQGDFAAAEKFFEEGLAISRQLSDESGIAYSLAYLGELARTKGDNEAARPLLEVSLAICRQLGNKQLISENLVGLGFVEYGNGDYDTAHSRFAEGLIIAQELGDRALISCCLDGFAALAAERGELQHAAQRAGLAKQLCESIGYEMEPAERRFRDTYTAKLKTKMNEADFTNLYEQGRKLKLEEAVSLCLEEIII